MARALLEGGPATASELAEGLGLTTTAVRRHLDSLEAEGHVTHGERAPYGPAPRRGRGRPARVYALTTSGRDAFEQDYDDLAVDVLRYLVETGGPDAVLAFARHRSSALEHRFAAAIAAHDDPLGRVEALAEVLADAGYAAAVVPTDAGGAQLCQHHCPVAHVAEEFPALCEAETEAFSRLLGRHVTRLATIAHGDGVCTTLVPLAPASTDRPVPATERSSA